MLILEGPDGSGKTSLANRLVADYPALQLMPKAVSSEAKSIVDVPAWVKASIDRGFGPYLYDRYALISEFIYGPAWKGRLREGFQDRLWLANASAQLQALVRPIVIICLPPFEVVKANILADTEFNKGLYYGDRSIGRRDRIDNAVGRIYWPYYGLAAMRLDYGMYDYTVEGSYESLTTYIDGVLESREMSWE